MRKMDVEEVGKQTLITEPTSHSTKNREGIHTSLTENALLWAKVTKSWHEVWWVFLLFGFNVILGKQFALVPVPVSVSLFRLYRSGQFKSSCGDPPQTILTSSELVCSQRYRCIELTAPG